jgi:hypothetical protein
MSQRLHDREPTAMTPMAMVAVAVTVLLALLWFVVSWLVLHSPLTDAVGETAGSLAVALLVISILAAARAK